MINGFKKFFKELKRVRGPSGKEAKKTFGTSTTFIIITSLVLFGLAIGLAALGSDGGVGLNG